MSIYRKQAACLHLASGAFRAVKQIRLTLAVTLVRTHTRTRACRQAALGAVSALFLLTAQCWPSPESTKWGHLHLPPSPKAFQTDSTKTGLSVRVKPSVSVMVQADVFSPPGFTTVPGSTWKHLEAPGSAWKRTPKLPQVYVTVLQKSSGGPRALLCKSKTRHSHEHSAKANSSAGEADFILAENQHPCH